MTMPGMAQGQQQLGQQVVILENGQPVAQGELVAVDEETGEIGVEVPGRGLIRVTPDDTHQVVPAGGNDGNSSERRRQNPQLRELG